MRKELGEYILGKIFILMFGIYNTTFEKNKAMKYILEVEEDKVSVAEELFKSIPFVRKVIAIQPNEIINQSICNSIEQYENGKIVPTPLNLLDLKHIALN